MDAAMTSGTLAESVQGVNPNRIELKAPPPINLPLRILILCAGALLLAWLPRLRWGFWTDEAGTFWMACKGWRAAMSRTATWPGQSIPYSVLESFFVAAGFWKEPLLRIPSVLASAVAAWHLKRLAELTINRGAGWLAVIPLICAPDMVNFGTSARPYALALAASIASFRYLLEWRESPDRKTAAKYLIASLLTLHFHYLFGFIFVIQAVFLAGCRLFDKGVFAKGVFYRRMFGRGKLGRQISGRTIGMGLPLAAVILLPASLLPLVGVLRSSAHHADGFARAVPPAFTQLVQICFPPALLLTTGLGLLLLWISARNLRWQPAPMQPGSALLLATWLTLAPVTFFLAARLTGQSIFAARYLLFTLPAFVLFVVWIISGFERQEWRFLILLAIFAGTVLHPGSLLQTFRDSASSWREPLRWIAANSAGDAPPVFVTAGVVDSSWLDWKTQDANTSGLYAPVTAYPIPNRAIGLPFRFGEPVQEFIRQTDFSAYKAGQRFFLLATADSPLGGWMSIHLKTLGFHAQIQPINDYVVIQYSRE